MTIHDYIIITLTIVILFLIAYIYFSRSNRKKDVSYIESIIDSNFSDLLDNNEIFQTAYLKDIDFLQRKLKELENKIAMIENYKQVDLQVNNEKHGSNLIEIEERIKKDNRASRLYKSAYSNTGHNHQSKPLIDAYIKQESEVAHSNTNDQVLALYKKGFTIEEISKELQIMLGEIQLIIALAKRQNII